MFESCTFIASTLSEIILGENLKFKDIENKFKYMYL